MHSSGLLTLFFLGHSVFAKDGAAGVAPAPTSHVVSNVSDITILDTAPGEINCRSWVDTDEDVNYYTCTAIADRFQITNEKFFMLNPEIKADCSNIVPLTTYCVAGFIEPVRATDGLCGPKQNNATCLGMEMQCCNAETFKCGNSTQDRAPGTCYEGLCPGDKVYSTDGTCGYQNGNRFCAGKWGDCCNSDGKCGTGSSFCGVDSCQSGNCTKPAVPTPSTPSFPWLTGNTTDGTCGGDKKYGCNVLWGNCFNKIGVCGDLPVDCGVGCQPQFGRCCSASPTPTNSPTPAATSSSKSS
ncbi:hypothetical protein GQ44DRAFT_744344 [Phaeosphaeriaceae sp. PMI808]|nr:hypothetical protein GQ44DRAFT_744344 [Phaeosphaeriaceae sp. PMI808]